ncbi:MAG: hypothetical protein M5R36_05405 [Deltaproteobacteria bacterium]|nr:hypothetical protein [Deltaproteobacteria bacterium]
MDHPPPLRRTAGGGRDPRHHHRRLLRHGISYSKPGGEGPGGLCGWIEGHLAARFPDRRFEVINAAAAGRGSNVIAEYVDDLLAAHPKVLVVITGNNEAIAAETKLNAALQNWVVYRALKKGLVPEPAERRASALLENASLTRHIEETYRRNIERIASACRERDVTLILATLPINYRYDFLADEEFVDAGDEHLEKGAAP